MDSDTTVLVFYVNRELTQNPEVIKPFVKSVNDLIEHKKLNMVTFFVPTDGEEKIECVNPKIAETADMDKIKKIVSDLENQFDIGKGAD